jgi:hypothetical protein
MTPLVTLSLEAELDLLFRVHPAEFVDARGALVARLTKTGERATAAAVKALKRPTPAAWALNQIHFEAPGLLERAARAATQVRELHARDGVTADALRAAMVEQRAASSALVDDALRRLESAGLPAGAVQQKKLAATVQGWLGGADGAQPGRMTHDLEFGGFEAIATVGTPAREPAAKESAEAVTPPASSKPTARDAARLQKAQARVAGAEQRALAAREVVRRRKEERDRLREHASQAALRVRETERTLEELREEARRADAAVVRSERAIEEALASQKQADAAAASARAALPE